MREAIEKHEFILHYQPVIGLKTGKIISFGALLRWRTPEFGDVYPEKFISVAESSGLIIPIGEWALQQACIQCKAWRDAGFSEMRVGVNFSLKQFKHCDLIESVSEALGVANLLADGLELEFSETVLLNDSEESRERFTQLKNKGYYITIDGFETGYSYLSYQRQFPIDKIKIYETLIRNIDSSAQEKLLTETIIHFAKSKNITVHAKGVETNRQLEFLRENQCDQAQGFLFSKPLSAQECTLLLRSKKGLVYSSRMIFRNFFAQIGLRFKRSD